MTDYSAILNELRNELILSLEHLAYSYQKIKKLNLSVHDKNPDSLESFEALVSRFARVTDIFLATYLRTVALHDDPAYSGTLRDWVNYAEKKGLIVSAAKWMSIRELRNKIAHEYASKDLAHIFNQVLALTPDVLAIQSKIK